MGSTLTTDSIAPIGHIPSAGSVACKIWCRVNSKVKLAIPVRDTSDGYQIRYARHVLSLNKMIRHQLKTSRTDMQ